MKPFFPALLLAAASCATMAFSPPAAPAGDLSTVTTRAQEVADQVSSLEHEVAHLRLVERRLQAGIGAISEALATDRLALTRAESKRIAAEHRLVAHAVEAYKSPPGEALGALLGSHSMTDVAAWELATSATARANERTLHGVLVARRAAARLSAAAERHKAELLGREERLARVRAGQIATLQQRKSALGRLRARISELQRAARIEQRRARRAERADAARAPLPGPPTIPGGPGSGIAESAAGLGPATGLPARFLATGVAFAGLASWYGPGFAGQSTANGDIFDPGKFTAASKTLPLPTWLYVTRAGRGIVVLVNDRGPYSGDRILDLSQAAARSLGVGGVSWVRAEVIVPRAGG
jgi:peptidoglycan lytic transglycosylase